MSFDLIGDKRNKIHFIGIGGISMSGLAEILLEHGYAVTGSDSHNSKIIEKLISKGALINIGHNGKNVEGANIVVYTAAISKDNPELLRAQELNLKLMDRAEFLGYLMQGHKFNVAVAGTHGKTTTTSMLSHITLAAKLDPTILVGGELDAIGGNVRSGKSDYFITEACEYKGSFLKFYPYIGIVLNIDADHLDYYKNIDDIENAFLKFANLIPQSGFLIANSEDSRVKNVGSKVNCNVVYFGIESGQITAQNIHYNELGCANFDVYVMEKKLFSIQINVPGRHNILNALAATSAALCLGIEPNSIKEGLSQFKGTHRRFEIKGVKNGITVIDDYAHHPTEIKATLSAAKNYPHKRIVCVFQPHTYSRTKALFKEFSESFTNVDELILADIYAAREKDTGEISSQMLADKIKESGTNCVNIHDFSEIVTELQKKLHEGDILITVGAGDVFRVGEDFLKI